MKHEHLLTNLNSPKEPALPGLFQTRLDLPKLTVVIGVRGDGDPSIKQISKAGKQPAW